MENSNFEKSIISGEIFLKRLYETKIKQPLDIINPNKFAITRAKKLRKNKIKFIGRLDGAYYYKFTIYSFINYIIRRFKYNNRLNTEIFSKITFSNNYLNDLFLQYLNKNSKWLIKNSEGIVFQSNISLELNKFIMQTNFQNLNYTIINNGIDLDKFKPKENNSKKDTINLVISASNYRLQKRLSCCIKLFNAIHKDYKNTKLIVIGKIDNLIKNSIKDLDTKGIEFLGQLNQIQLLNAYQECDVMISIGLFEACPNVGVEALALGMPVLSQSKNGISEITYGSGWVVNSNENIGYYDSNSHEDIPKIDIEPFQNRLSKIIDDLSFNKKIAREIAIERLDIKKIAKKYNSFASSFID